jgi:hypothetical protein
MLDVYTGVHQLLVVKNREREPYSLLPAEQDQVPGPCPACGLCGYLARTITQVVHCLNASCNYEVPADQFESVRRNLLFDAANGLEVVYYIRFRDLVKIGWTTSLKQRCSSIQTVQSLYGFEPGGRILESRRHRQFAGFRRQGEWFDDNQQIRAHINKVCELAS